MFEELRLAILPWYMEIKFLHLLFVMIWGWSTSVAYVWYVKAAWLRWFRQPDDTQRKWLRDWAMEQFDKGAILEHIAFPVVIVTGPLLFWLAGWPLDWSWLTIKLLIILVVFVPMEIFDYWIAHGGGNKTRLRLAGDEARFERVMMMHWRFFQVTTPLVSILVPVIIYLAVVKPF